MSETKTFLVWEQEYPEDGSYEVDAASEQEAIQKHRDACGAGELEDYDAMEMTPEIAAQRAARAEFEDAVRQALHAAESASAARAEAEDLRRRLAEAEARITALSAAGAREEKLRFETETALEDFKATAKRNLERAEQAEATAARLTEEHQNDLPHLDKMEEVLLSPHKRKVALQYLRDLREHKKALVAALQRPDSDREPAGPYRNITGSACVVCKSPTPPCDDICAACDNRVREQLSDSEDAACVCEPDGLTDPECPACPGGERHDSESPPPSSPTCEICGADWAPEHVTAHPAAYQQEATR